MRSTSKKYVSDIRESRRQRNQWHTNHLLCQICTKRYGSEVHHIAGRNSKRCDLYERPFNWLSVCMLCHQEYDKESPAVTVCAAKMMADIHLQSPEFDLERLREVRDGRRFSFTLEELQHACDKLEIMRRSM